MAKLWSGISWRQGHTEAQFELGWSYEIGEGVASSRQEDAKWWRLAAEKGHADAQFYLGWMYDQGIEFAEDVCKAAWWYMVAAYNGLGYEERSSTIANLMSMWYEYNKSGVAIPDPDYYPLAFVNRPFLTLIPLPIPK